MAETVWAELPEKVQRVAESEGRTRSGIRTLLEKQAAEIAAADDELSKSYCVLFYLYLATMLVVGEGFSCIDSVKSTYIV